MLDNILTLALIIIAFSPILLIMGLIELHSRNEKIRKDIRDSRRVAEYQRNYQGRK